MALRRFIGSKRDGGQMNRILQDAVGNGWGFSRCPYVIDKAQQR